MFFRKKKELESTLRARTKALREAENRVIEYSKENKTLRNFYDEVSYLVTSNTYRADNIILGRIRDLVRKV